MSFKQPMPIKVAIENIYQNKYLLPAIQRGFVWKKKQVLSLFDSLIKGYPIGSFLLWEVKRERKLDFQFYKFIQHYHERDKHDNERADVSGDNDITAVLDGQQRLTSLYIGLKGSYAVKLPRKHWDRDESFPVEQLYFDVLSEKGTNNFQFLSEWMYRARYNIPEQFWFKVGQILDFEGLEDLTAFLMDKNLSQNRIALKNLTRLWDAINHRPLINYFQEEGQQLDKVLDIFIRVNSGGTKLSKSDLLLSTAIAQWQRKDAREEITEFVNIINRIRGFYWSFDKDFILKTGLVLTDIPNIAIKVDNFTVKNVRAIESSWDSIKHAIKLTIELITNLGYQPQTLTSKFALIPIIFYLFKKGYLENFLLSDKFLEEGQSIQKWLAIVQLKRVFTGQTDNVLRIMRGVIQEHLGKFPLREMVEQFRTIPNKSLIFDEDDIQNLLHYQYGASYTFPVLSILYPTLDFRVFRHQDHIFPKKNFNSDILTSRGISAEDQRFYMENYNSIGNLQLLEGNQNLQKQDKEFADWLKKEYANEDALTRFKAMNYIPDVDLSFTNFREFFLAREALLLQRLKDLLGWSGERGTEEDLRDVDDEGDEEEINE